MARQSYRRSRIASGSTYIAVLTAIFGSLSTAAPVAQGQGYPNNSAPALRESAPSAAGGWQDWSSSTTAYTTAAKPTTTQGWQDWKPSTTTTTPVVKTTTTTKQEWHDWTTSTTTSAKTTTTTPAEWHDWTTSTTTVKITTTTPAEWHDWTTSTTTKAKTTTTTPAEWHDWTTSTTTVKTTTTTPAEWHDWTTSTTTAKTTTTTPAEWHDWTSTTSTKPSTTAGWNDWSDEPSVPAPAPHAAEPTATIYPAYTSQYNGKTGAVSFHSDRGLVSRSTHNGGADISALVTFTLPSQYAASTCQLVFDLLDSTSYVSGSHKAQLYTALAPATASADSWPSGNLRDQSLGSISVVQGGRATWEAGSGPGATVDGVFPCAAIAGKIYGGEVVPQGDEVEFAWPAAKDGVKILVW